MSLSLPMRLDMQNHATALLTHSMIERRDIGPMVTGRSGWKGLVTID